VSGSIVSDINVFCMNHFFILFNLIGWLSQNTDLRVRSTLEAHGSLWHLRFFSAGTRCINAGEIQCHFREHLRSLCKRFQCPLGPHLLSKCRATVFVEMKASSLAMQLQCDYTARRLAFWLHIGCDNDISQDR